MAHRNTRSSRTRVAISIALALTPMLASGQSRFPERPLRLVVPFAPGGVNDIVGRRYAQEMTKALGQSMIVENRAGASGAIGSAEVARAKPDGHVLLIANTTTHVINPIATANLSYDALKDFAPISVITVVPTGVAVHPSMPVRTLKQLIAFAKANPGKLSYGSAGTGQHHQPDRRAFQKAGRRPQHRARALQRGWAGSHGPRRRPHSDVHADDQRRAAAVSQGGPHPHACRVRGRSACNSRPTFRRLSRPACRNWWSTRSTRS